jgi:hypothetical protein
MPSNAGNLGTPGVAFPSNPPLPGVLVGGPRLPNAAPAPAGVIRRLPTPDPIGFRASRPDTGERQEGSIPAYGNTLNFGADESVGDIDARDLGMRPKSSMGVWLMAVLLAAAALGGIAFFAVKRGPLAPDQGNGSRTPGDPGIVATSTTSATLTPPQPTVVLPSTSVVTPPAVPVAPDAGTVARDAGTPTPPAVTPTPPVRAGGFPFRPGGAGHAPRNPGRPATPPTSDTSTAGDPPKPPPVGLAPDPFGTPE